MPRIAYVNGRYLRYGDAVVHVEDRGLQFADSVYEVCAIWQGRFLDERRHLDRLERSLGELDIESPVSREAMRIIMREVVRCERVVYGSIYIQVTRGVAPRNHAFPVPDVRPGLIVMARHVDPEKQIRRARQGVAVITLPETRWSRVDIKTTSLVANVLAKQAAHVAGAEEAWFVDADGNITEGSSSNAWIVSENGAIVTRFPDQSILRGITREVAKQAAEINNLTVEERPFTLAEALSAREAFITSASNIVTPIVKIDGIIIADGQVGPVAKSLRECFYDVAEYSNLD